MMVVLNVDIDTWLTLRSLNDSINYYTTNNVNNDYNLSIKKTKELKEYFIKELYERSN